MQETRKVNLSNLSINLLSKNFIEKYTDTQRRNAVKVAILSIEVANIEEEMLTHKIYESMIIRDIKNMLNLYYTKKNHYK